MDHLVVLGRSSVGRVEHLPDTIEERDRFGPVLLRIEGGRFVAVVVTRVVVVRELLVIELPVVVLIVLIAHRRSVTPPTPSRLD